MTLEFLSAAAVRYLEDLQPVRWFGLFGSRVGVSEADVRAFIATVPDGWGMVTGGCLGPKPRKVTCGTCRGRGIYPPNGTLWDAHRCHDCDGAGKALEPQRLTAVDWFGIKAAMERRMPVLIFPADFEGPLGLAAGPIRNALVVKYSEIGRGFGALYRPDGRLTGTGDTEQRYRRAGKDVKVKEAGDV